jgi:hypothetical protein
VIDFQAFERFAMAFFVVLSVLQIQESVRHYQCYDKQKMAEDNDLEFSTPEGDEYVFPVREIPSAKSPGGPGKPPTRQNQGIGGNFYDGGQNRQIRQNPEPEPLLISIVDDLSTFERRTLLFGQWGLGVSIASILVTLGALLAAILAACAAFSQLGQMQAQTEILFANTIQAGFDSVATNIATAQRLDLLQRQLTQQSGAMELDQRAWISLDHYELEAVPNSGKTKEEFGQALAILRNTGKTPALNVHVVRGAYLKKSGSPNNADSQWMDLITERVEKGSVGPNGMPIAPKARQLDKWGHDWEYEMFKGSALLDDRLAPPGVVEVQRVVVAPGKGTLGSVVPLADPLKVPVGLPSSTQEGVLAVVYGTVFYEDVFGKHHQTTFCGIEHAGVPIFVFNTYSLHGEGTDFTDCAVHNKMN